MPLVEPQNELAYFKTSRGGAIRDPPGYFPVAPELGVPVARSVPGGSRATGAPSVGAPVPWRWWVPRGGGGSFIHGLWWFTLAVGPKP